MIDGRRSSFAARALIVVAALIVVPALLRATQQLGHGAKIRQVCGLSTSASWPPDRVAPSLAAVLTATVARTPPPGAGGSIAIHVALPGLALVPVQAPPRAPPSLG